MGQEYLGKSPLKKIGIDKLYFYKSRLVTWVSLDDEILLEVPTKIGWEISEEADATQVSVIIQDIKTKVLFGFTIENQTYIDISYQKGLNLSAESKYRYWLCFKSKKQENILSGPYNFRILTDTQDNRNLLITQAKRNKQRRILKKSLNDIALQIENGKIVLSTLPWQLTIGLYGRGCNIDCNMCGYPYEITDDKDLVSDYYSKIVNSISEYIPNIKSLNTSGGEPLLYPEMRRLLECTWDCHETQFSMSTNGHMLNEKWTELLSKQKLGRISFSIDAATEDTYKKIRTGSKWSNVINGIKKIVELRGSSKFPLIFLNFIVFKQNYREIEQVVELGHQLGVNGIVYQFPNNGAQRGFVQGYPHRSKLKMEWIHESTPINDENICGDILKRLDIAYEKMHEYGMRLLNSNVKYSILRKYPKSKSQQNKTLIQAGGESCERAINKKLKNRSDSAPEFKTNDFGLNPEKLFFNGKAFVVLIFMDPVIPNQLALTREKEYLNEYIIPLRLPNGRYEVALMWNSDFGYQLSKRAVFELNSPERISPADYKGWDLDKPGKYYNFQKKPFNVYNDLNKDNNGIQFNTDEFKRKISNKDFFFCSAPFTSLTLKPNTAAFCCHAKAEYRFINTTSKDIRTIWNSEKFQEARSFMLSGEGRKKVCTPRCPHFKTGFIISPLDKTLKLPDQEISYKSPERQNIWVKGKNTLIKCIDLFISKQKESPH